jgi:MFS family permease
VIRLALALFAIQAGFHGFTASLPLALHRGGVPDPEIGLIIGSAALVQVPAALVAGALVDRLGGIRMLVAGAAAYAIGAAILLLPGVEAGGDRLPFVAARIFQGVGIAATLPSALSLVPRLVPREREGFGLAFLNSAHNLTLVVLPPLSIAILGVGGLDAVTQTALVIVAVGVAILGLTGIAALARMRPVAGAEAGADAASATDAAPAAAAHRRFGLALRPEWIRPLLVVLLYISHWGVVTAYLPQRAEAAHADVGLFFAADGLAILFFRVPIGWLADRVPPRRLVLLGIAVTAVAIALLLIVPSTPTLVVTGILTGAGAGLTTTPLLLEMSRRSTEADRGSAFALYSGALAAALVVGSIGVAPLVAVAGFEGAIAATIGALALAAGVAVSDRGLATAAAARIAPTPA